MCARFQNRLAELRCLIENRLSSLVDRDYRLLEIPDYPNPGDVLIYEGERCFLKTLPHRCIEQSTMSSFQLRNPHISKDELLIFRGGGYFGDLWPMGPRFQAKILERYPDNPMIIFPQSACFSSSDNLRSAVERYGAHHNLTICMRDSQSYDFVRKYFSNQVLLVPDLAFYADVTPWHRPCESNGRVLFLRREDVEFKLSPAMESLCCRHDVDISDWPTMQSNKWMEFLMGKIHRYPHRLAYLNDWMAKSFYRSWHLSHAIRFLEPYDEVYSTRLHGCVLALLMGKTVHAFDNSTGKVASLIKTWLDGVDSIILED